MSEQQADYETDAEPTPGPWTCTYGGTEEGKPTGTIKEAEGHPYHIANTANARPRPEQIANARLIAAAPDLLAAARWARKHVEQPKALEVINDAIAKAEGRADA